MTEEAGGLTVEQISALLHATTQTLRAELQPFGSEAMRWHPAEGEWCINEILGHLLEAERRSFAGRIQEIVEQPGRRLVTWDQAQVAQDRRDCERDGHELVREFEEARNESIHQVEALRPDQLALSGDHPDVGDLRVTDVLHVWLHHDRNHAKQLFSNVQAYVWPHMGNAQHFSISEG
ncbi:MAG: DinB family protein [Chloroflexi bacterium]|nr:DinB family protein [Chloroflexota bacterium]